jgi:hypothetical protein
MARVSRRALIAAGLALPAAANAAPSVSALQGASLDPLVQRAGEWIALRTRVDTLSVEADDLEGELFARARALGMTSDKACRSAMPEARAYRAKKREFDEGCRKLEREACVLRDMRATTVAGAIAKIELSLHIQYEDWSEHAFEFVEDGIAELRLLTAHGREQL